MAQCKGAIGGKLKAFLIDGVSYDMANADTTIKPILDTREAVDGEGFTVNETNTFIEVVLRDKSDLPLKDLFKFCNVEIVAELQNGKTYAWADAWYGGEGSLSAGTGEISCRFESMEDAEEVLV